MAVVITDRAQSSNLAIPFCSFIADAFNLISTVGLVIHCTPLREIKLCQNVSTQLLILYINKQKKSYLLPVH